MKTTTDSKLPQQRHAHIMPWFGTKCIDVNMLEALQLQASRIDNSISLLLLVAAAATQHWHKCSIMHKPRPALRLIHVPTHEGKQTAISTAAALSVTAITAAGAACAAAAAASTCLLLFTA
jgi:hypothetical protein